MDQEMFRLSFSSQSIIRLAPVHLNFRQYRALQNVVRRYHGHEDTL